MIISQLELGPPVARVEGKAKVSHLKNSVTAGIALSSRKKFVFVVIFDDPFRSFFQQDDIRCRISLLSINCSGMGLLCKRICAFNLFVLLL